MHERRDHGDGPCSLCLDEGVEAHPLSALKIARGGQHAGARVGVLLRHVPTGACVWEDSERSQMRCLVRAHSRLRELLALELSLRNLLARIHSDGGHHVLEHGLAESARVADDVIARLFALTHGNR